MTRRRRAVAAAASIVLALTAISSIVASGSPPIGATVEATLVEPAVPAPPPLAWTPCDGAIECATLQVPLSYRDPGDRVLHLALRRHRADDAPRRIGSLVVNPGGPGEAGTQLLRRDLGVLTSTLRARFDVVEMDPRGVGASLAVRCPAPATAATDPVPIDPAAEARLGESIRAYVAACVRTTGIALLRHVGTEEAARDLEQLRIALGDDRLTFLGLSYGSLLGATYADRFPTRVRAMVLDGAIDPARPLTQLSADQARGLQDQLDGFLAWCDRGCAWRTGGRSAAAFDALAQRLRAAALPSGPAQAGVAELYRAALSRMSSPSRWPSFAAALAAAERADGAPLLDLARAYVGVTPGSTINADASIAINCADHPVARGVDGTRAAADAAAASAPQFGPYLAWGALVCALWPAPATRRPHPVHATGAPPIVVVGTTHDPDTPYGWAVALARQLDRGVLLTRAGTGHVAYLANSCVRARLDRYVVDTIPPDTASACPG